MSDIPGQWRVRYTILAWPKWWHEYFSSLEEAQKFCEHKRKDLYGISIKSLAQDPEFVTVLDLIRES